MDERPILISVAKRDISPASPMTWFPDRKRKILAVRLALRAPGSVDELLAVMHETEDLDNAV